MVEYILTNWMDVLGTTLGLLYIYLEFRENAWMWVVGSVMPVVYFIVLYQKGIYGDCLTEVYAFFAGIYGLYVWLSAKNRTGKKLPITRTPARIWAVICAVMVALWAVLAFILKQTDSTVAYLDALSTAFYLVALWMLARKYLEQWLMWFVCDALSTGLYVYKDLYGRALLYGIYTALAIYGYYRWKQLMTSREATG